MAKVTRSLDDLYLYKEDREVPADVSYTFGINGEVFQIDLCKENADKFDNDLAFWTEVASPAKRKYTKKVNLPNS